MSRRPARPRKRATRLAAPVAPVLVAEDADGAPMVVDWFALPAAMTAEESAAARALRAKQGLAASQAHRCAEVDAVSPDEVLYAARRAAARAASDS